MASLVSCAVSGVAWCFCTATASLFSSCCGNDKPSTVDPGLTSGRKRSVLLLVISIAISFAFQYGIASYIADFDIVENFVTDAWRDGCEKYETDQLIERCVGTAGAYRSAASATIFFALASIAVACKPTANREAWPAKYVLFLFMVFAFCFIPNEPFFLSIYLNVARAGAVFFIFIEQIIIVDIAYNWNDSWVEKSNNAESEEIGSGSKWLYAIAISFSACFIGSLIGFGLLYHFFSGCSVNIAFITVTMLLCLLVVAAQMSGEEGSLLASSVVCLYATSLCYSAVSKNPNEQCNPFLGEEDILGIAIGVGLTLLGLAYAGWAATADTALNGQSHSAAGGGATEYQQDNSKPKVTGVVANQNTEDEEEARNDSAEENEVVPDSFSHTWKLNVVLMFASCFFAMSLTSWGAIESGGDAANPEAGRVSMWMIITSQWIVLCLYLWTLVAPRLFPDREFS